VTRPPAQGGLGFDARWEVAFYHNLIGDSDMAGDQARLLKRAGCWGDGPLHMDWFSGALYDTCRNEVVFHESHDEAGNSGGTARTMVVAVDNAPLVGATRIAAEARSRLCFGLSLFSAGTPMFFMAEEIGAQKCYKYDNCMTSREDIMGERAGNGKYLFRFYQDAISLSKRLHSMRNKNIDIISLDNDRRVIAFKRWDGVEEVIVVASFSNFPQDYVIEKDLLAVPDGVWKEVFNSDAAIYGGGNIGNRGASIRSSCGRFRVTIPPRGLVVFVRQ